MWGCARRVSQEGVGEAGVVVRARAAAPGVVSPGAGEKPGLRSEPVASLQPQLRSLKLSVANRRCRLRFFGLGVRVMPGKA